MLAQTALDNSAVVRSHWAGCGVTVELQRCSTGWNIVSDHLAADRTDAVAPADYLAIAVSSENPHVYHLAKARGQEAI